MFGRGVGKNEMLGMSHLTEGAMAGSRLGCFLLGTSFAKGLHGLPKDAKQATKWYRKMQACTHVTVTGSRKEEAATWLREHATD